MSGARSALLPSECRETFERLIGRLAEGPATMMEDLVSEIASQAAHWSSQAEYMAPARNVDAAIVTRTADLPVADQATIRRALVSRLALTLPALVERLDLPDCVLELYPGAFRLVSDYLESESDEPYDPTNDCFLKDVRFVLGSSVPCGAQVVDLISHVSPTSVVRSLLRSGDFASFGRYVAARGHGPWFRIHTEARDLSDFNQPGWERCYERVGALMARRKEIRGMVGTTWFYDPQIVEISPHLAYLQQRILAAGAFPLRHGTGQIHVDRATQTSRTRRRLYQEGQYVPICYSILWPRRELLAAVGPGS